jgi:hypothetical protein
MRKYEPQKNKAYSNYPAPLPPPSASIPIDRAMPADEQIASHRAAARNFFLLSNAALLKQYKPI